MPSISYRWRFLFLVVDFICKIELWEAKVREVDTVGTVVDQVKRDADPSISKCS